jgi:hypothetical protein
VDFGIRIAGCDNPEILNAWLRGEIKNGMLKFFFHKRRGTALGFKQ